MPRKEQLNLNDLTTWIFTMFTQIRNQVTAQLALRQFPQVLKYIKIGKCDVTFDWLNFNAMKNNKHSK